MGDLESNYKYFFKYLGVELTDDLSILDKLFQEETIIYRPEWGNETHPYQRINNWITFQQIMNHNALYFTHYPLLNDPFECVGNIDYSDGVKDDIIEIHYDIYVKKTSQPPSLSDYKTLVNTYVRDKKKHFYAPEVLGNTLPFGIYSLSEDPANIQMWSYYANNHTGVAIIFEINWKMVFDHIRLLNPGVSDNDLIQNLNDGFQFSITDDENDSLYFGLQKVKYLDRLEKYPAESFMQAHFDEGKQKDFSWFLTSGKHSGWKHEAEWRLSCFNKSSVASDDLMCMSNFNFIRPCGIILGLNMKKEVKELIKKQYGNIFSIFDCVLNMEGEALTYSLSPTKEQVVDKLK